MLFGHYVAWISAGIMGAGAAVILKKTIAELDPGDVAFQALGASGYVIVIVAGGRQRMRICTGRDWLPRPSSLNPKTEVSAS